MAWDIRNLIRPVGPGLPGALNPLAFIGAGMANNNLGQQLAIMGQLRQGAVEQQIAQRRLEMEQAEQERLAKQREAMSAIAPGVAKELFPESPSIQQLMASNPKLLSAAAAAVNKPQISITNIPAPPTGYRYAAAEPGQMPRLEAIPGGPAVKPTERQQDVSAYAQNAEAAERMLGELPDWSPTGVMAARNPVSRLLASEADKRASDYQLAWTMAVLRAESGAAISPAEAEQQIQVFFEQPGDTEQQKADKKALRQTKVESMRKRAGSAYAPLQSAPPSAPPASSPTTGDAETDALMRKYLGP